MTYFDKATETLPREQLRELQFQKLRTMFAVLWERNALYQRKWRDAGVSPYDLTTLEQL